MKPLRPQLRGLIFKLTLFYILLSLPSLVLVESAILIFEFESFMSDVEGGSLLHAGERGAQDLASVWPSTPIDEPKGLATWAEGWLLRLQRPRGDLIQDESFLLIELSSDPLAAAVLAPDGHVLAQAPTNADWKPELPQTDGSEWSSGRADDAAKTLTGSDSPYKVRRVLAPVRASDGSLRGFLFVELRLPLPWHRFLLDMSLEWPIVLGYLIVFGIASSLFLATWVTRRLNHVARAATAWSSGDFSHLIGDRSRDELGRLSALLDRMALELKALMRSRAQFATLAERQRLARDLHDTVKQKAFALNLQLATARRQLGEHPASERVVQAERLSQQIQQELVQILDELRSSDAELPLVEQLRMRALEWAQSSGMPLDLNLDNIPPLPTPSEDALLRIADEALANVMRHSRATRASLNLHRDADKLVLEIADNGQGTSGEARGGMGLANMRERAQSLPDGQFTFDSGPDRGTRVEIRFSIEETSRA
jgi:signal transduction histidine kinase